MEVVREYPWLYKRGSKGEVRVWRLEVGSDGTRGAHRSVSGIKDKTLVTSSWNFCEGKNVGKKNGTTSIEQAISEADSAYVIRTQREYFRDEADIDRIPFTEPMLAHSWDKARPKDISAGVYAQPKLDGIRCIARADGLWTRSGKRITALPFLEEALAPLFADYDLILDGELYSHDLKDDFNTITSVVRKARPSQAEIDLARDVIQYHVYDLPSDPCTFRDRYLALSTLVAGIPYVNLVPTVRVDDPVFLDELYAAWVGDGYEGQMVRLDERYEFKRSKFLLKRKEFVTEEFEVVDVVEGKGNWAGAVKCLVVKLPDGRLNDATPRGSQEVLRAMHETGERPTWATVRYFGKTPDGKLRFPIAVDWGTGTRED